MVTVLANLSGTRIDRVHERRPPDGIILDMASSESPTYGAQEGSARNGHFRCTCYHPLFVFNQFGDLERCLLRPVVRPPKKPQLFFASFTYQAQSWTRPRRVVAKVEWRQGELYPRVGRDQPLGMPFR